MRLRPFILSILSGVIILNVIAGYYGQSVVKDLNGIVSSSPVQWRPVTHFALSLAPMFYIIGAAALAIVATARRIRRDEILIIITVSLLMVNLFTFALASWGLSTPPKDLINASPPTSTTPNQRVDPSADNVFSLPMKSFIYVSPGSALGHARCSV